jgi:hypothetical protein
MAENAASGDKPKAGGADEDQASKSVPDDVLTTEIVGSAEAYRRLGEIFISLLTAIPGAALIASLISGPGDAGFDKDHLALGLGFAVAAIGLGLVVALMIRGPVEIGRATLDGFDMSKIVGTNQRSYEELLKRIRQMSTKLADTDEENERETVERQLNALVATLRRVHLVATARELRKRATDGLTILLTGLALVAAACATYNLALATKTDAAPGTAVVSVKLTPTGATRLGCATTTFDALKIGGSDEEPQVVPLNGVGCEAGNLLQLRIAEEEGTAEEVKAVEAVDMTPEPQAAATTKDTTTTGSP